MIKEILPGIVTVYNPDPEKQIDGIKKLGIKKAALFLSGAPLKEREEYFKLLEQIPELIIPFVHARSDMRPEEFEYLIRVFQTKVFNLHPETSFPLQYKLNGLKEKILIENSGSCREEDMEGYAGLCLDFSHLEDSRLRDPERFGIEYYLAGKYPVGANHISSIRPKLELNEGGYFSFDNHAMKDLSEFNYLKSYPARFYGKYIAIELVNPLEEQLRLVTYLKNLLADML